MKKATAITTVFIIASIVANSWTALALSSFLPEPDFFPAVEAPRSDFPYLQGVTKSGGYYNICLEFSNVTYNQTFDNIIITMPSTDNKTAPTMYINGTMAVKYPLARLKIGDSLQVNFTLPCAEYMPGSKLSFQVIGRDFSCGKGVIFP